MRSKLLYSLFAAEALLCILLNAASVPWSGVFSVIAFPFAQIGTGLRALALTGRVGNATALMLYVALSSLPVWFLLMSRKKRHPEDFLLGLLSVMLFVVHYLMANAGKISGLFVNTGSIGIVYGKTVLGGIVYSILVGYIILRALRQFMSSGTARLLSYLEKLLWLLEMLFIWAIFGVSLGGMLDSFANLRSGQAGNTALSWTKILFIVLKFLMIAIPYAMNIKAVSLVISLLYAMKTDRFSEETVTAAVKLSRWCAFSMVVVVLSTVGFNILQFIFVKPLQTVNSSLLLPVFSVTFVLAVLLFARLITESRQLKHDNDLFI